MPTAEAGGRRSFFQALRGRLRKRSPFRAWGAGTEPRRGLDGEDLARIHRTMQDCLDARGGEVTASARAVDLGSVYLRLSGPGRRRFLSVLAEEFDVDHHAAASAAERLLGAENPAARASAERLLRGALEPPQLRLIKQFNAVPEGTKFLVDLRKDLLRFAKRDEALMPLEQIVQDLLASWFDGGFLELRRITWDSPASLLEKLARSEAVHAVTGWDDLKNRLDTDRRFYTFFHPHMPDEPIIFIEVALVQGLADGIGRLLDKDAPVADPAQVDTAIFYSISNAQRGLTGISFGGFLVKRVIDELKAELPGLKTFATLSPIPQFRRWLRTELANSPEAVRPEERRELADAMDSDGEEPSLERLVEHENWEIRGELSTAMSRPLMRLCAVYLLQARRSDGGAADPVANFHLSNGARIERVNWLADPSPKGLAESAGIMVNYLYELSEIEDNLEAYTGERVVAASQAVTRLARKGKP